MSRGKAMIVSFAIVLLITFGVMVFLMTTINPQPVPNGRRFEFIVEKYYEGDANQDDGFQYGLEKVSNEYKLSGIDIKIDNAAYKHDIIYDKNIQYVVPPIWPDENDTVFIQEKGNKVNKTLKEFKLVPPIKGYRRSIQDKVHRNRNCANSLVLKIVDDNGYPKIEIKMGRKYNSKNSSKIYRRQRDKNEFNNLSSAIHNSDYIEENFIPVEVNDGIVLNIVGGSDEFYTSDESSDKLGKTIDSKENER
ncbi:unnamed protein product, partial [Leptidea sinapis]